MFSMIIPSRQACYRGIDAINAAVERHFWFFVVLFVVFFASCAIVRDVRTKLWTDELFTLYVAQQESPQEIVKATLECCDGAPPLYAMFVHSLLPWVRHEAFAVRLPATLGYCGMLLCLVAFCRRRLPAVYALVAALLAGNACLESSTEGRPYGILLGCAAGSLLCWQAAADRRWRIVAIPTLAFCMALMTAMHYYAVFFLVPLFLGEVVRWWKSGKMDFAVLAAMASVPLVLVVHYPLITVCKLFLENHWSPARWGFIWEFYRPTFEIMCLLPLCVLAVFANAPRGTRVRQAGGLTMSEWVTIGTCSLMPLCVIVLSIFTTHVFVVRYVVWALPGIAVLVAATLCTAARGRKIVGVGTLSLLVVLIALREARALHRQPTLKTGEMVRRQLTSLPDDSKPIVVANYHVFIELSYYAEPRLRKRLIYPVSHDLDALHLWNAGRARHRDSLGRRKQLNFVDYDAVCAAHPRFVLAAIPKDRLPWHLAMAGYRVIPIGSSKAPVLFEVEAPETK